MPNGIIVTKARSCYAITQLVDSDIWPRRSDRVDPSAIGKREIATIAGVAEPMLLAVGLRVQDSKIDAGSVNVHRRRMFRSVATAETATKTDAMGAKVWSISDEVRQFREWGTGIEYPLPAMQGTSIIGAAADCWLRLWDPSGSISRRHASLSRGDRGWMIVDLDSKNGIFVDGVRVASSPVVPGAEIRIGSVTLIAESPKLVALRGLLERLIGWGDERREDVDGSLFSVRTAATHREPLLLCGAGNLVPIARLLHQHVLGDRPFVHLRPPMRGMEALAKAAGGTLCLWRNQQPDDLDEVVAALRTPAACALLMVCAHAVPRGNDIASQIVTVYRSIRIPPLAQRAREIDRIIDAYAADAISSFGGRFESADREWVASNASESLHQLGMATRRIVALHACDGSVTQASKLLGLAHGSLSDWLARRTLPGRPSTSYEEDDGANDD